MNPRGRTLTSLVAALGLIALVAGCGTASNARENLPEFASLEETYSAVDDVVDCTDGAPDPPHKMVKSGGPTGESLMCTNTVEVLWFESQEAREKVYELIASAAGSAGAVYFAEGRNWFVADVSEVAMGAVPERKLNLEELAENLDAQYTMEQ